MVAFDSAAVAAAVAVDVVVAVESVVSEFDFAFGPFAWERFAAACPYFESQHSEH